MHILRIAFSFGLAASLAAAADPALLRMIMPEARSIAGADVDRSKTTMFGQFLLSQMQQEDEDFRKFIALTGFDPRRDVREVLIASSEAPTQASHSMRVGVALLRGTFDPARIRAAATVAGARGEEYMGVSIMMPPKHGEAAVAFPDSSTAVIGDLANVKAAIARLKSGASADARIVQKVQEVSSRYDVWLTTTLPAAELAGSVPDPNLSAGMRGDVLKGIERATAGVRFEAAGAQIGGEAITRSDKDATALSDVVRFLANMVQLNRDKNEVSEFAKALDTLSLTTESNVVKFSISVPQDQIEKMIKPRQRAARKAA